MRTATVIPLNHNSINDTKKILLDLESGNVIFFPELAFNLHPAENILLNEKLLCAKHKNISYDTKNNKLQGISASFAQSLSNKSQQNIEFIAHSCIKRFSEFSQNLINTLFPFYQNTIQVGRTSYRPAEVKTRIRSKRQDDTRLHVDSFAATPVKGKRILRVFSNVHPDNTPRVWNIGEPFTKVLENFATRIPKYNLSYAKLLRLIKSTKTLRTPYDHYMLNLHDMMKHDDAYQNNTIKTKVEFPPHSTWIVFTDKVSHAALSGQFLFEQTFYLNVEDMQNPELSPLKILEENLQQSLLPC